jgi:radical SAM superfamily enzyme YgiQ (UPF0313 family)
MAKNVLLIAPYIHDFAAYDLWLKPLGLLYIAAAAEKAGYSVRIINCLDRLDPDAQPLEPPRRPISTGDGRGKFSFEEIPKPAPLAGIPRIYKRYGIPLETFRRKLREGPPPDAIGVGSTMTYWYPGVSETIQLVRKVYPKTPIILGGIYASLCPAHAREHSGADFIVEGPGERRFLDLLADIVGPGPCAKAEAQSTKDEREKAIGGSPLWPAYHLLERLDSISMLTSRGCPFSCAYCASRLLSDGFAQRPVMDVVEEIQSYVDRLNMRDIAFYDDALLVNPENHIKPILREVTRRKLPLHLHAPNGLHANLIDEELAELMRKAGFATIRLSVESVHPARLKDSCMKVTIEGFRRGAQHLFAAGYPKGALEAYVLMGVPEQEPEEVEETMQFLHNEGVCIRLADFSPIPGTEYYRKAAALSPTNLNEPLFQNSSVFPHLIPGLLEQTQKLKSLARSFNDRLMKNATPRLKSFF